MKTLTTTLVAFEPATSQSLAVYHGATNRNRPTPHAVPEQPVQVAPLLIKPILRNALASVLVAVSDACIGVCVFAVFAAPFTFWWVAT